MTGNKLTLDTLVRRLDECVSQGAAGCQNEVVITYRGRMLDIYSIYMLGDAVCIDVNEVVSDVTSGGVPLAMQDVTPPSGMDRE